MGGSTRRIGKIAKTGSKSRVRGSSAHPIASVDALVGSVQSGNRRQQASAAAEMNRSQGRKSRSALDNATSVFEEFKDSDSDKIGPESLERFFDAIELDPLDISALIFAWKLNAQTPCEFSRSEFVEGLANLGADSIPKLKRKVRSLESYIEKLEDFRSFYVYSFDYNKPQGQRSLPVDIAKQLWQLLLQGRFARLDLWLEFLNTRTQPISRDSYVLLFDFANTILPDFSNFDEVGGAWPVILDEFVEFAKPRIGTAQTVMDSSE